MEPVAVKSKTQIVSVLFVDIVGYSKRSVTRQVEIKRAFNEHLGDALSPVLADDWILLDTGDGAAIAFLNSPEEALLTSDRLMALAYPGGSEPLYSLRSGLHLGPVVIVRDVNGSANLVGDAINDAQRIMSFAGEDEVFSSRQYAELVARIDTSYVDRFSAMGYMQDKHGRAHDLAKVSPAGYTIPEKFEAVKDSVDIAVASLGASEPALVESPPPTVAGPTVTTRSLPSMAVVLFAAAAIALVGWWLFWRDSKPVEAPPAPAVESSKAAVGIGAAPSLSLEKPQPSSASPKPASPAPSVAKSVQESRKPAAVANEMRLPITQPRSQVSTLQTSDCPQCSCPDLLAKVSRGATLSVAETTFLRTRCQWQDSPQSGGVGKSPALTKQPAVSMPAQQPAGPKPVPLPQAQVQSKLPDKVVTDARQPVAPSGQTNVQAISDCSYCSCPDLLTKVSLGLPLSSAETRFLRTKCQ